MRLELWNWMRFRGKQTIELGPNVYGLVAEWRGNSRRSNWAGKTAILEAFRFVLFGVHRFETEDEWITEGEVEGGVSISFGNFLIVRERKRGGSTRLRFCSDDAANNAMGDVAQELIARVVGLSREEWTTLCWFGQKRTSAYVLERPAARLAKVREWCGMAILEDAHDRESKVLAACEREAQKLVGERESYANTIAENTRALEALDAEDLDADEKQLRSLRTSIETKARELAVEIEAAKMRAKAAELQEKAARAHADLPEPPNVRQIAIAKNAHARAVEAASEATKKKQRFAELARGEFDGRCPVTCEACPASESVRAFSEKARDAYAAANLEATQCTAQVQDARRHVQELEGAAREYETAKRVADRVSADLAAVADVTSAPGASLDVLRLQAQELATRLSSVDEKISNIVRVRAKRDAFVLQIEAARAKLEGMAEKEAAAREQIATSKLALRALGKSGAQRVVGRGFTSALDGIACDILRETGVALTVSHRWGRPTAGFEAECPKCGADAGRSKAKRCGECGAERAIAFTDELDVVLSNRSGAAEDLAGLALQLGASELVRRARGSRWDTVFVDEPFGALDEAHVSSVGTHFARALRGPHGFERAIVVAHHRGIVTGFPGLIVVEADERESFVTVQG